MSDQAGVLVIGIGNPGRQDDGLGPAAAAAIEKLGLSGVTVDADYQLNVEDAQSIGRFPLVLFVDADAAGEAPFSVQPVRPREQMSFSTHSVEAEAVLHMAHEMFAARTRAYMVGIRGYAFEGFGEVLSPQAQGNLDAAVAFLAALLRSGDIDAMAARLDNRAGAVS
jgi:hydrogenase maturation protease